MLTRNPNWWHTVTPLQVTLFNTNNAGNEFQPADRQRPQAREQGIEVGWQVPAPDVTLDAFHHGQKARQAGAERHDLGSAAGQQQLFILVAQGGRHLAHYLLQGIATQLAQAV
ncbi:hypothetical protein D3C75_1206460 [compost metagenome]